MPPCLALSIKGWTGGKSLRHTSVMSWGDRVLLHQPALWASWLDKANLHDILAHYCIIVNVLMNGAYVEYSVYIGKTTSELKTC